MKNKIAKTLLVTSVLCMSASSFAQRRTPRDYDRDTRARHDQLRDRHRDMNICSELEEDLIEKEINYQNSEDNLRNIRRQFSQAQSEVESRRNNLQRRQSSFSRAQSNLETLTYRQDNRVTIIRDARAVLNTSQATLPGAVEDKRIKKEEKERKCKGMIRVGRRARACKKARRALESATSRVSTLRSRISSSQSTIRDMATIDTQVTNAQRTLNVAQSALSSEQTIQPSISSLEADVRRLSTAKRNSRDLYINAEEYFVKADMKLSRCIDMRYQAKKAPVFKKYLLKYTSQGCNGVTEDLRYERGRAAKAAVEEAYKLVCDTEAPLCAAPVVATPVSGI